jgi:hypothetical protein
MKTTVINKILNTMLFAAVCGIALAALAPKTNLVRASESASAVNPKVIEITAQKFEFTPSEITTPARRFARSIWLLDQAAQVKKARMPRVPKTSREPERSPATSATQARCSMRKRRPTISAD